MTNDTIINRFLNHLRRDRKSILTLSAYATDLKQFSAVISPKPLAALSSSLFTFYCVPFTRQFSLNSRARKLTSIREFLRWCHQQGYIKKDLSLLIDHPKRESREPAKPLSRTQIGRLRRSANPLERLLLELLLQTGLRLRDIVKLKTKNVNLNNSSLTLPYTNNHLPMTGHLFQVLEYHFESKGHHASDALVMSPRGKKISIRTATTLLANLSKKARVHGATPRNIRTTFIVRQLEAGTPIETLQHITGHQTIAPLERYLAQTKSLSHNRKVVLANV